MSYLIRGGNHIVKAHAYKAHTSVVCKIMTELSQI